MENVGENGAIIHSVSSVPVMSSGAEGGHEEEREDGSTKTSKNRRVSFAASSQFLEPINPFDILGEAQKSVIVVVIQKEGKKLLYSKRTVVL